MRLLYGALLTAAFTLAILTARAQQPYVMIPSTPDIAVTESATEIFAISQPGGANWLFLRNDCGSGSIYFGFGQDGNEDNDHPLRLDSGDEFAATMKAFSLNVSGDNATAGCTFTFVPAR